VVVASVVLVVVVVVLEVPGTVLLRSRPFPSMAVVVHAPIRTRRTKDRDRIEAQIMRG